jgi:NADH:ubiquinone oxidoreductase subunit
MHLGTRIFTYLRGTKVGEDSSGNRYFTERRPSTRRARVRRWVIYPGVADPSSVPAEWHVWLHYTTDAPLSATPRYGWQRPHRANATGTAAAYRPPGHDYAGGRRGKADGDYESWAPDEPHSATPPPIATAPQPQAHFTLVRHSGYAVAANPALDGAVEVREVTPQQVYMVRAAGGAVFTTREAAMHAEDTANYPDGVKSAEPRARGQFSTLRVAGSEIYVPQDGLGR